MKPLFEKSRHYSGQVEDASIKSSLRQVLEQFYAYIRPTVLVFLDFKGAFDSVDRSVLLNILARQGMLREVFVFTNARTGESIRRALKKATRSLHSSSTSSLMKS